jgi:hypothetical protein
MVYKLFSFILLGGVLVLGGFYVYERYTKNKLEENLNNQIAQLQQTVKEKDGLYSKRGVEIENLKSENKDLQKIIKNRDEQILAMTDVIIKLKDKIYELQNVIESMEDVSGNPVDLSEQCRECLLGVRFIVGFDQTFDYLNIGGYCKTNPGEVHIELKWVRPLKLNLILTKDKNDNFRAYLDAKGSDIESAELNLKIDPSIFDLHWYERLYVQGSVGLGSGLFTSVGVGTILFDNFAIGSFIGIDYDGKNLRKFYGGNILWWPLK